MLGNQPCSKTDAPPTPGGGTANTAAPKLPPSLFECYKQYKLDSERLATWLCETAQSLGFKVGQAVKQASTSTTAASNGGGRLKGKARKAAAAAARNGTDPVAPPVTKPTGTGGGGSQGPEVMASTMPASQFIPAARFIADSTNPSVSVPYRVIDWGCRAIHYRRYCSDWFRSDSAQVPTAAPSGKVESDRSHVHFISVLEQVVAILAPRVGSRGRTPSPNTAAVPESGVELLQSRFAALALDDHALDAEGEAARKDDDSAEDSDGWDAVYSLVEEGLSTKQPTKNAKTSTASRVRTPSPRKVYRVKHTETDEDEVLLAYLDFLYLLSCTRKLINDTWRRYTLGEIALEAAGLYTCVATDRMHAAYESFVDLCPLIKSNHYQYSVRLFEMLSKHRDQPAWYSKHVRSGGEIKVFYDSTWDWAELTQVALVEVVRTLLPFLASYKAFPNMLLTLELPSDWPDDQVKLMGVWSRRLRKLATAYQGFHLSTAQVMFRSMFDHVKSALETIESLYCNDSKPYDLLYMTSPTDIPPPTLFVLQTYLDIADICDDKPPTASLKPPSSSSSPSPPPPTQPLQHIMRTYTPACNKYIYAIQQTLALQSTLATGNQRATITIDAQIRSHMLKNVLWLGNEAACRPWDEWHTPADRTRMARMLQMHPWLAGVHLANLHHAMHATATDVADGWGCVHACVYMYRLMELLGLDLGLGKGAVWPLMDELIHVVIGSDKMFVGRTPADVRTLWTNLTLTYGALPRRATPSAASRTDRWALEDLFYSSSRLNLGESWLWSRLLKMDLGPHPGADAHSGPATPKQVSKYLDMALIWWTERHPTAPLPSGNKPSRNSPYPLVEFLIQFRNQMHEYCEEQLGFNFLLLHVQAVKALKMLCDKVWPRVVSKWEPGRARGAGSKANVPMEDRHLMVVWHLVRLFGEDDKVLQAKGIADPVRERQWARGIVEEFREFVVAMVREDVEAIAKMDKGTV